MIKRLIFDDKEGERILVKEETAFQWFEQGKVTQEISWSIAGGDVWLLTTFNVTEDSSLPAQFLEAVKQQGKWIIPLCEGGRQFFYQPETKQYLKPLDETLYAKNKGENK